jgi:hypothetical protein
MLCILTAVLEEQVKVFDLFTVNLVTKESTSDDSWAFHVSLEERESAQRSP